MNAPVSRAFISLYFDDDIKTFPAIVVSEKEPVLIVNGYKDGLFLKANKILIKFSKGNQDAFFATIGSIDGSKITFIKGEPYLIKNKGSYHWADYKGEFTISLLDNDNIDKSALLAEQINSAEKNSLSRRLRQQLTEGTDSPEIISYLAEIDSKLNKILDILKPDFDIPGGFTVRGVSLSGGGFRFYTTNNISLPSHIFVTATLADSSVRVKFASLCKTELVTQNIYEATFYDMDEDIRDEIIKFVFSKERDILQSVKQ